MVANIVASVARSIGPCSVSTRSQSKPADAISSATRGSPKFRRLPKLALPARRRCFTWLGVIGGKYSAALPGANVLLYAARACSTGSASSGRARSGASWGGGRVGGGGGGAGGGGGGGVRGGGAGRAGRGAGAGAGAGGERGGAGDGDDEPLRGALVEARGELHGEPARGPLGPRHRGGANGARAAAGPGAPR